jgi:hypothetical protein
MIVLPNEDWGRQMALSSQTKSLEERTNDSIRIFQSTFQGRSAQFGRLTIEKSIEERPFILFRLP